MPLGWYGVICARANAGQGLGNGILVLSYRQIERSNPSEDLLGTCAYALYCTVLVAARIPLLGLSPSRAGPLLLATRHSSVQSWLCDFH